MYFYVKHVTLDGTIIYIHIKQCFGSKCLLLKLVVLFYDVLGLGDYITSNGWMVVELETIWNEVVVK
jgi:hypothetical protein